MHAVASVTFRADQVVSGVAINMLGIAIALFSVKMIFGKGQTDFIQNKIPRFNVPILQDIPDYRPDVFQISIWNFCFGNRYRSVGMVRHL